MRPFQPVVVRGFSKYTRIATNRSGSLRRLRAQPLGVLQGGIRVVDAAGADDDQQPVVDPVEDRLDLVLAAQDELAISGRSGRRSSRSAGVVSLETRSMRVSRTAPA